MSNQYVQKIASVILVLGIFVSIFMAVQTAQAQVPSGVPFGGTVISGVPATPVCTAHTIIFDYLTHTTFGVAIVPGSQVYMYGNLVTPGTFVLGSYIPTPIPCLLPYPIWPISQVGTS